MKSSEIISLIITITFIAMVGLGAWVCYQAGGWLGGIGGGLLLFFVLGAVTHKIFNGLNRTSRK